MQGVVPTQTPAEASETQYKRGLFHAIDWRQLVDKPETEKELEALRRSVNRGTPFGDVSWTRRAANRLHLQSTLRPVGRPRKKGKN